MRVLLQSRSTLFTIRGGDTVQVLKTAAGLRELGVQVDVSTEPAPPLRGYDIVHLFNLGRPQELYVQARNARRHGTPIALSTVYCDFSEYERFGRRGLLGVIGRRLPRWQRERAKVAARAILNGERSLGSWLVVVRGYYSLCKQVIEMADVMLPNSKSEMNRVRHDFPTCTDIPVYVVPNAIDVDVFDAHNVKIEGDAERLRGCILSVARIEGLKCQMELVHAAANLDASLVLIGVPAPNHRRYYENLKRAAGKNVHFVGHVDHLKLASYYSVAKVHALVSWMETTGLSSLEAGAMGCNLVITDKGDTREYFRDEAVYCDPASVDSISGALQRALAAPRNTRLQNRIRSEYTWERAAQATFDGYTHIKR